eukprot:5487374-Prymnesium_polylepis.1
MIPQKINVVSVAPILSACVSSVDFLVINAAVVELSVFSSPEARMVDAPSTRRRQIVAFVLAHPSRRMTRSASQIIKRAPPLTCAW